jgi:uncharacterized protein (DUF4415 family)
MKNRLPLTDKDGEVRELKKKDLKSFKTAGEVLPPELVAMLPRRGRPISETPKIAMNIRLSPDVIAAFKGLGRGWQTRINDALRDWLKEHPPA